MERRDVDSQAGDKELSVAELQTLASRHGTASRAGQFFLLVFIFNLNGSIP